MCVCILDCDRLTCNEEDVIILEVLAVPRRAAPPARARRTGGQRALGRKHRASLYTLKRLSLTLSTEIGSSTVPVPADYEVITTQSASNMDTPLETPGTDTRNQ